MASLVWCYNTNFTKGGRPPFLSLNELGENLEKSYFRKFSKQDCKSNFEKMFSVAENLKALSREIISLMEE